MMMIETWAQPTGIGYVQVSSPGKLHIQNASKLNDDAVHALSAERLLQSGTYSQLVIRKLLSQHQRAVECLRLGGMGQPGQCIMHDTARGFAYTRAGAKRPQGIQKEGGQGKLVQLSPTR